MGKLMARSDSASPKQRTKSSSPLHSHSPLRANKLADESCKLAPASPTAFLTQPQTQQSDAEWMDDEPSKMHSTIEEVRAAEVQHVAGFTFEAPPPPPAVSGPLQAPPTIAAPSQPSASSAHNSPAAAISSSSNDSAPAVATSRSPLRSSVSTLTSTLTAIAVPVGSVAKTVFGVWFGAVGFGVSRALSLRSDWIEGQGARRKLAAVMRARAEERVAAKRREKQAMERLQELEQQIHLMQQQLLLTQQQPPAAVVHHSPACCRSPYTSSVLSPLVPRAPAMTAAAAVVPVAPPMTAAASSSAVPMAPPMSSSTATSTSFSFAAAPVPSKPSAASLLAAAGQLKRTAASSAVASAAPSFPKASGALDLSMLRSVQLRAPGVTSSRPPAAALPQSNSSFLLAALNAKFNRGGAGSSSFAAAAAARSSARPSFGLRSAAPVVLATPMPGRPVHFASAFSPMTPASEEQWTPAR